MDSTNSSGSSLLTSAIDARTLLQEAAPLQWVVEGLLVVAATIIMAASPKVGKTYLAMYLALCVASGKPFFGRATQKRRVFYVFLEDGRRRVAWRLKQLGLSAADDVSLVAVFDVNDVDKLFDLLAAASEPYLVIIDPLVVLESHFDVHDENVALQIEELFARLRTITQASASNFVIVHHFRKAGDVMRGSVALQGSSDGWWNLDRDDDGTVTLHAVLRDAEENKLAFEMVTDGESVQFEPRELKATTATSAVDDDLRRRILNLLAASNEPLSQKSVAEKLGVNRNKIQAQLAKLEANGSVSRPKGPKGGYAATPSNPIDFATLFTDHKVGPAGPIPVNSQAAPPQAKGNGVSA